MSIVMESQMLIDNLDEKFEDETSIVTASWLSVHFDQPIYESEKLLANYLNKRKNVCAVYLLNGLGLNGEVVVKLVPQHKLDEAEKAFSQPPTKVVYSLHRKSCTNSPTIAGISASLELTQENLQRLVTIPWNPTATSRTPLSSTENSGIHCFQPVTQKMFVPSSIEKKSTNPPTESHVKNKDIGSFFTPASKPECGINASVTTASKSVRKRPSSIVKAKNENIPVSTPSVVEADNSEDDEEILNSASTNAKRKRLFVESDEESDLPAMTKRNSKSAIKTKNGDKESCAQKGKTKSNKNEVLVVDSETDSPVTRNVPRGRKSRSDREQKQSQRKNSEQSKEEFTFADTKPVDKISSTKAGESSKLIESSSPEKHARIRRQVMKTFQDEEGFMVTEKAWESVSEDEEQPTNSAVTTLDADEKTGTSHTIGNAQLTATPTVGVAKSKVPFSKKSNTTVAKPAQKQSSLSNFFKRV